MKRARGWRRDGRLGCRVRHCLGRAAASRARRTRYSPSPCATTTNSSSPGRNTRRRSNPFGDHSAAPSEIDLPQADDVRINDVAPVMRAAGESTSSSRRCASAFRRRGRRRRRSSTSAPRAALRRQPALPRSGLGVLRVHGDEVPQDQASLHAERCAVPGDRRPVARRTRQSARQLHDADDRAGTGRGANSQSPSGRAAPRELDRMAEPHQARSRVAAAVTGGIACRSRRAEGSFVVAEKEVASRG